jgi:AcrR family transcriptional regulator
MVQAQAAFSPARDRLLEAAERVVRDIGAARLTLDGVAQAAGVSKGGLLYHFPSKEALLGALAQRYVDTLDSCIDSARLALDESDKGRELKACILGVLGDDPRSKGMGAALLAAAANDPALLEVIRERIARYTQRLMGPDTNFARAAIVSLAVDGLKLRESLRISSFSTEQRAQIVEELLKVADESFKGHG